MRRRSFFTGILQSVAAIAVASSMEVFAVKPMSFVDQLLRSRDSLERAVIEEWEKRSRIQWWGKIENLGQFPTGI